MLIDLPKELIYLICCFLTDEDALKFFMANKVLYLYAENYIFNDFHSVRNINYKFKYRALDIFSLIDYYKIYSYQSVYVKKLRCYHDGNPFMLSESLYDNVTHLEIDSDISGVSLERLPTNLKYLKIDSYHDIKNLKLPNTLVYLRLVHNTDLPKLPDSLVHLEISGNFNKPINTSNLHNLKRLFLYGSFDLSLDNLPDSLERLKLPCSGNPEQTFHINKIPKSLNEIIVSVNDRPHTIEGYSLDTLPKHIRLTISNQNIFEYDYIKFEIKNVKTNI
jgi:hypothetical protein